jgi:hypothetical protein
MASNHPVFLCVHLDLNIHAVNATQCSYLCAGPEATEHSYSREEYWSVLGTGNTVKISELLFLKEL